MNYREMEFPPESEYFAIIFGIPCFKDCHFDSNGEMARPLDFVACNPRERLIVACVAAELWMKEERRIVAKYPINNETCKRTNHCQDQREKWRKWGGLS